MKIDAEQQGVRTIDADLKRDSRGSLTETFRASWVDYSIESWSVYHVADTSRRSQLFENLDGTVLGLVSGRCRVQVLSTTISAHTTPAPHLLTMSTQGTGSVSIPPGVRFEVVPLEPSKLMVGSGTIESTATATPIPTEFEIDGLTGMSLATEPSELGTSARLHPIAAASPDPAQWNTVTSSAGTIRGVHVHPVHYDLLHVVAGSMMLGVQDLRRCSATFGQSGMVELNGDHPALWTIAPGIAHGFHFLEPTIHTYAMSEFWNVDHHLGCRWDDPDLDFRFDASDPALSAQDENAGGLRTLIADYEKMTRA